MKDLQMLDYIKAGIRTLSFGIFIYLFGIRFYRHPDVTSTVDGRIRNVPIGDDIASLIVRVVAGYTITFKFSKERIEYLLKRRGKTKLETSMVYSISAHYTESAPEDLKKYSTVRLCVPGHTLLKTSEDIICKILVETYMDYISGLVNNEVAELKDFRGTRTE